MVKFSGGSKASIFVLTSGNLFPGFRWWGQGFTPCLSNKTSFNVLRDLKIGCIFFFSPICKLNQIKQPILLTNRTKQA